MPNTAKITYNNNSHPRSLFTWLFGTPLPSAAAPHQTIGKAIGLAVFASDALSSTAYATQEILIILALAGTGAFYLSLPISLAIVALLAIVTLSYEQTIHAYPNGGGAYIVAKDNLGTLPAQVAAAALLTDYVLTVAVSISSAVAQIVSAFPSAYPYSADIAVALVMFVMLVNLRGVRESGTVFAIPTYFFLLMMSTTVLTGIIRYFSGTLGTVIDPPPLESGNVIMPITLFLILRAFASGTTALTGVEAISNGITAFKEPRSRNAGITLIWMSIILGSLFLGITFLALHTHAIPSDTETIISQIARTALGSRNLLYLGTVFATTLILVMAANTAFADFPRLSALLAADGFMPRQFTMRGSRLVFSTGITALALIASLLIVIFRARVTGLIPLYAVGVFVSFTLSQTGMARHWWRSGHMKLLVQAPAKETTDEEDTTTASALVEEKEEVTETRTTFTAHLPQQSDDRTMLVYDRHWKIKMAINGFGALCTSIVAIVFAVTKFIYGAWIILILIPLLVTFFSAVRRHYADLARQLSLEGYTPEAPIEHRKVILLVAGVHRGSLAALRFARSISDDITAVHVSIDAAETEKVVRKWQGWGEDIELIVIDSPYREIINPLIQYIKAAARRHGPEEVVIVIIPEFVPQKWWQHLLHMQTANIIRMLLLFTPDVVIIEVPYRIGDR